MQISEVSVKVCRVVHPCQSVNARCSLLLDIKEGPPQDVDADVMQERCQFLLLVPGYRSSYAGLRLCHGFPTSASGPCFAVPHSSWSHRLPPPTPQWIAPLCSPASQVLSMSLTSSSRSSSATASGLPDAALGTVSPGRNEDLPVPAQEMCVHAQGLKTTQGGQGPRDDGPVPVAFCMPRRHRHPGLHCFRRSIPRLYAPLSTLRVLPRGSVPRMTTGVSVDRYSFTVTDFHHLPLADFPGAPRLNGWPMRPPVNASPKPSRATAHELGADVDRYSLIVRDLHSLLLAGLPALRKCLPGYP